MKVSTRYWRDDWKIVVKPTPVRNTPMIDGHGFETCPEVVPINTAVNLAQQIKGTYTNSSGTETYIRIKIDPQRKQSHRTS